MQLSKAGVVTDESVEQKDDDDSCMAEPTTPEHAEFAIPSFPTDSEQLIHAHELGSDVMIPAEDVCGEVETVDMVLRTTCRDDEEGSQRMVCQLRKFDLFLFVFLLLFIDIFFLIFQFSYVTEYLILSVLMGLI